MTTRVDEPLARATEHRRRSTRLVLTLSWASLIWMTAEGAVGLWAGYDSGSIALVGWAFGSVVEGLASVIVIWRFTGSRRLSETAERQAQRAVGVGFYLLAVYIAVEATRSLVLSDHAGVSTVGIVVTAASVVVMPALGLAKRRLGAGLGSGATAGEGTQNLLCAAQALAVLIGMALNSTAGWWWADPIVAYVLAAWAIREGRKTWEGEDCC